MKVNGNHKNGSQKADQTSSADHISKKAVTVLEDIPLRSFDAQSTWEKLAKRLGQVDKRFMTWGIAMAASFSLLVAANIDLINWQESKEIPEPTVEAEPVVEKKDLVIPYQKSESVAVIEQIVPHTPEKPEPLKETVIAAAPPVRSKTVLLLDKQENETLELYPLTNPFVSVFAKANFQSSGITPEVGIDFKLAENFTARRRDIYKLGISSQLNFRTNEAGEKKVHPHTFVNLEFTSLNKKTKKGWTTRAGYLLNPDGYLYQDTTIKVSVFRNIGKHIKIGPEVIFTDNLKQAYPSLSLILG